MYGKWICVKRTSLYINSEIQYFWLLAATVLPPVHDLEVVG